MQKPQLINDHETAQLFIRCMSVVKKLSMIDENSSSIALAEVQAEAKKILEEQKGKTLYLPLVVW